MRSTGRLPLGFGLLALVTLVGPGNSAVAQAPDPRLDRIFADWQKRQNRIQTIRYHVRGEHRLAQRPALPQAEAPPLDIGCPLDRTLLLDFATGRHRLETNDRRYDRPTGRQLPDRLTVLFDGTRLQARRWPPDADGRVPTPGQIPRPDIGITTGPFREAAFPVTYWPLVIGHGLIIPNGGCVHPGHLRGLPDARLFHVHGEGQQGGRPCLLLRAHPPNGNPQLYDEFWVDPAQDSAVVRQTMMGAGGVGLDLTIAYQETAHGWLPREWTVTAADDGVIKFRETVRVEELTINPAVTDADFRFAEEPGLLIAESAAGGDPDPMRLQVYPAENVYYRVGADGRRQEVTLVQGVERPVATSRWGWWLLGLLGVALVGTGVWWWRR